MTSRILMIGMSDNIGGIETFFHNYYGCFDLKKYHFDFVTVCNMIAFEDEYRKNGAIVYKLPSFLKHPFEYYNELRKILRDGHYDVVHINMLSAANILPVRAALKEKVPKIIVHSHNTNMPKGFLRKILHYKNKNKLKRTGLTRLACGEPAGEWLFGKGVDFCVINNAIDVKRFKFDISDRQKIRKKYNICDDEFLIGNIGRICEQKNQDFLIEVFRRIKNQNIKLMIVGDGNRKNALVDKIGTYELEDRVIIAPPTLQIEKYYSAFDVFVLPSRFEGMPVVLVEAQANGLKSIISDSILDYPDKNNIKTLALGNIDLWVNMVETEAANFDFKTFRNSATVDGFDIESDSKKLVDIYNGSGGEK